MGEHSFFPQDSPGKVATLLLVSLMCMSPALAEAGDSPDLGDLKRDLNNRSYQNYWNRLRAIRSLGKIGNLESTKILAEFLDDSEPPIQEALVLALGKLENADAIGWLSGTFLKTARKPLARANALWALRLLGKRADVATLLEALGDSDATVRARAALALGRATDPASAAALGKSLKDADPEVRREAARALGAGRFAEGFEPLRQALADSSLAVGLQALRGLPRIDASRAKTILEPRIKDAKWEVRLTALEAWAESLPEETLEPAIQALGDSAWQVRVSAIAILGKLRTKEILQPLIDQLGQEKGRLRLDIVLVLQDVTGKQIGFSYQDWKIWWEANKDNFEVPAKSRSAKAKPGADPTVALFFDIPLLSDRLIFLIDFSGSMKHEAPPNPGETAPQGPGEEGRRKIDIALGELERAIGKFPPERKFNIILVSTEATQMKARQVFPKLSAATPQNQKQAIQKVRSTWKRLEDIRRGRGDVYDAILEAFGDQEVDTLVVLSDGVPTYGKFVELPTFLENLGQENQTRKIAIHTVLTGEKGTDIKFMQELAESTGGLFVHRK